MFSFAPFVLVAVVEEEVILVVGLEGLGREEVLMVLVVEMEVDDSASAAVR